MRKTFCISVLLLLCVTMSARKPGSWLELPVMSRSELKEVYTVEMSVGGRKQRNYTFLWNAMPMSRHSMALT